MNKVYSFNFKSLKNIIITILLVSVGTILGSLSAGKPDIDAQIIGGQTKQTQTQISRNKQKLTTQQKPTKANLAKATGISLPQISPFSIKRDNLNIRGYNFVHPGTKRPTIILSHGLGENQILNSRWIAQQYQAGYNVTCFDFIGGGYVSQSDGNMTDMSVVTEEKDLRAVINYVKTLASTDIHNLVLEGDSQGGLVSALVAGQSPDEFSKLILNYPAFSIPDDTRTVDANTLPDTFKVFGGVITVGKKYVTDAQSIDVWSQIKNFKKPVMMNYGTSDGAIDQSFFHKAEQTYSNIKSVSIPGVGLQHGFFNPLDFIKAQNADVDFLK